MRRTCYTFGQFSMSRARTSSIGLHSSRYTLDVDVMGDASSAHHVPDLPQSTAPRLGAPGTPEFFASVLGFIRATAPGFPLDPVIFQSIILSVMAGNKHVLLRTREEDIAIVQNLAALVSISTWVSSARAVHKRVTVPGCISA